MHQRAILGSADVTDATLTELVAVLLGQPPDRVTLLDSLAAEVDYELVAITTAGRYWVTGSALVDGLLQPFRIFVKHVQSWGRSPLFADVPPEIVEVAEAGVPWRTEPESYRSDLAGRLPHGLTMPRTLGVFDIDDKSASIWMEAFTPVPAEWDLARYSHAAHLLGRLAASPAVRERTTAGESEWAIRAYVDGRVAHQVVPMLMAEGTWQHPLMVGAFDDVLRDRLQAAASRAQELVGELTFLPVGTAHGDACPNNLLVTAEHDGFVLIDYGFWREVSIGFDLGQLLVGDIQMGRRAAALLQATEDAIVQPYIEGLQAEGLTPIPGSVRRAHALQFMLFTGLSSPPFEYLADEVTPALQHMASERAAIARFALDLLDEMTPAVST